MASCVQRKRSISKLINIGASGYVWELSLARMNAKAQMASDKTFLIFQLIGLFIGLIITDGGIFLVSYLVALVIPNIAYYLFHRKYSSGPIHILLILSPLIMVIFVILILKTLINHL